MQSMTGFATTMTEASGRRWRWEAKSVNGRGLDLRLRVSDVAEADEAALRAAASRALSRGSVTVFLREDASAATGGLVLNEEALRAALDAAKAGEDAAAQIGLDVSTSSIAEILAIKGVLEPSGERTDGDAVKEIQSALNAGFGALMTALNASRAEEGARLQATLGGQIDQIETLTGAARVAFHDQMAGAQNLLADRVKALMETTEIAPDRLAQELALLAVKADITEELDRLTQELALLAVKADITEELDRLTAHIAAARDLLNAKGPVGRKFDFLTQEFNREVNTLCSKSGSGALTAIGLDLKVVVDQMREQAANVE